MKEPTIASICAQQPWGTLEREDSSDAGGPDLGLDCAPGEVAPEMDPWSTLFRQDAYWPPNQRIATCNIPGTLLSDVIWIIMSTQFTTNH